MHLQHCRTRTAACLLILSTLLLTSCGMAGLDADASEMATGETSAALEIITQQLPDAQVEGAYPPTQLGAAGAYAPVVWRLTAGDLPPGVDLSPAGILSGQPACEGIYEFTVEATDGLTSASRDLALAVDTFGTSIGGLNFGEAWAGEPITLDTVGCTSTCAYEVVSNHSGGAFDALDPVTGRAVWIPGNDVPATDRLRVTESACGVSSEVTINVVAHPAPHFLAEFGSTDVWYLDMSHCFGAHGLPRDWDEALRMVGLRSTDVVPTVADEMASWLVRRELLSVLNVHFGRNADGTRGSGVAISFPFKRPRTPYTAPLPGTWASGAPQRYNIISLLHGSNRSITGYAFVDSVTNARVENDTTSAAYGEMGVHANQIARSFNAAYQNNTLPTVPVCRADEYILRALIHGKNIEGERAMCIRWVIEGLAKSIAGTTAHEIGHSLGLQHTGTPVSGSIMNGGASIGPFVQVAFLPIDMDQLRSILPGPGRMEGSQKASDDSLPPGGISACRTHVHLEPAPNAGGCSCAHGHE